MNKQTLITALLIVIIALLAYPQVKQYLAEEELKAIMEAEAQKIKVAEQNIKTAELLKKKEACGASSTVVVAPFTDAELLAEKEELLAKATTQSVIKTLLLWYEVGFTKYNDYWDGKECFQFKFISNDDERIKRELSEIKDELPEEVREMFYPE